MGGVARWGVGALAAVLIVSLGCNSAPTSGPIDGGFSIRPRIVVPAAAGTFLASGLFAASDLEQLLAPIMPAAPLEFQYEWSTAPGMVMLALPQATADHSAAWVSQINSLPIPADAKLYPLETDLAFCDRDERQNRYWAIPTAPTYKRLSLSLSDGGIALEIDRIRGQLVDLTILPENPDSGTPMLTLPNGDIASFRVSVQLRSLHMDARLANPPWPLSNPSPFSIDIPSLQASCVATITPAKPTSMPSGLEMCGDQKHAAA